MKLVATIDVNGNTYIGKAGRDEQWIVSNVTQPKLVKNDFGGSQVDLETIMHARASHPIQGGGVFYAEKDVFDFCTELDEE